MAKYPPMGDLLRNQRRRSRRGRWPRRLLIVAVLAAVVAGWWWYSSGAGKETAKKRRAQALSSATRTVADSLAAARAPLAVEEAPDDLGSSKRDEELTALWAEGEEAQLRGVLEKNQSVFLALQDRNLSPQAIHKVVTATGEKFEFRRSRPGDEWYAEVNAEGTVTLFRYQTSPEDIWETKLTGEDEYECTKVKVPVDIQAAVIAGTVDTNLWNAMIDRGEKGILIYRFADIFAYSVDFNTETRPGDRFAMVFEKVYLDGEFLRYGKIIGAMYGGGSGVHYGFHYRTDADEVGYYDENGENLQRQFLKSPLASVRVTSTYGKRYHPVLKRMRMHHGIDYGAPVGTPIRAVADGTVRFAGWKGANGRLIVLSHAKGYRTYYAHLSKIEKGIRPGKRVTKKTIIGRVGNSGRSTGPHLHFGMKRHGRYVNPRKVDFARAPPLEGEEKERYIDEIATPLKEKLDKALDQPEAPPAVDLDEHPSISPG